VTPPSFVEELGQEPAESLTGRGGHWLRSHPVLLAVLVLVLVGAAVPLLVRHVRSPQLPTLNVSDDGTLPATAPWQAGPDGRPSGPVVLSVTAKLLAGEFDETAQVIGIAGPGLRQVGNRPIALRAGSTVTGSLSSTVDCAALPATLSTGAYGLRVRVQAGSRSSTGVIHAGTPGERWRTMIQLASVSKTKPQADLTLTLTNTGSHPVTVTAADSQSAIELSGGLPIKVPAHSTAKATFTVVLKRCDSVAGALNQSADNVHLTSVINLVGLAGTLPVSAGTTLQVDGDGLGATGIVLDPDAGRGLISALNEACGKMAPSFALIAPNSVRYQTSTQVLTVPVTIYTTPGRVRSLRLQADRTIGYDGAYLPLTTSVRHLVPDVAGLVQTTLRFHAPATGACADHAVFLPGILVTMDVVSPAGTRTVSYDEALDLNSDPHAMQMLCGSS
jgi:hypothetical protein